MTAMHFYGDRMRRRCGFCMAAWTPGIGNHGYY